MGSGCTKKSRYETGVLENPGDIVGQVVPQLVTSAAFRDRFYIKLAGQPYSGKKQNSTFFTLLLSY